MVKKAVQYLRVYYTLSRHNVYGENNVPIWSDTKNLWYQPLLHPIPYAYGLLDASTQTSTITLAMSESRNVAINFLHICMVLDFV